MKKTFAVACGIALCLMFAPRMLAKGKTTKIVIEGANLAKPLEITDQNILASFNVWTGPGTSSSRPAFNPSAPSFIVDWSQGPVTPVPETPRKYQISFYSGELPKEHLIYVVYYVPGSGSEHGFVYLPGKADKWLRLNVSSIFRGVEGKWFHAWSTWEDIARPLIETATAAGSTPSTPH